MIDQENHPEMLKARAQLMQRLHLFAGLELNKTRIDEMTELVKRHRCEWRERGVDFPELRLLCIPRLGVVDWVREDLSAHSVAQLWDNMIIHFKQLAQLNRRRALTFRQIDAIVGRKQLHQQEIRLNDEYDAIVPTKPEMLAAFRYAFPRMHFDDVQHGSRTRPDKLLDKVMNS